MTSGTRCIAITASGEQCRRRDCQGFDRGLCVRHGRMEAVATVREAGSIPAPAVADEQPMEVVSGPASGATVEDVSSNPVSPACASVQVEENPTLASVSVACEGGAQVVTPRSVLGADAEKSNTSPTTTKAPGALPESNPPAQSNPCRDGVCACTDTAPCLDDQRDRREAVCCVTCHQPAVHLDVYDGERPFPCCGVLPLVDGGCCAEHAAHLPLGFPPHALGAPDAEWQRERDADDDVISELRSAWQRLAGFVLDATDHRRPDDVTTLRALLAVGRALGFEAVS